MSASCNGTEKNNHDIVGRQRSEGQECQDRQNRCHTSVVSEIIPTVPSTQIYREKITPLNPTRTSRPYSRKCSYWYNVFHNSNRCEVPPSQSPRPATPFFRIYEPYWVDREFTTVTHKRPKLHWDTASSIKQPELMRYVLFRATKRLASLTWRPSKHNIIPHICPSKHGSRLNMQPSYPT